MGLEDADAKGDLLDMIELYRQAAKLADDAAIPSAEALIARIRKAWEEIQREKPFKDGLLTVRKSIGAELAAAFPEDLTLTADSRKKAADLFARIKGALEAVK